MSIIRLFIVVMTIKTVQLLLQIIIAIITVNQYIFSNITSTAISAISTMHLQSSLSTAIKRICSAAPSSMNELYAVLQPRFIVKHSSCFPKNGRFPQMKADFP